MFGSQGARWCRRRWASGSCRRSRRPTSGWRSRVSARPWRPVRPRRPPCCHLARPPPRSPPTQRPDPDGIMLPLPQHVRLCRRLRYCRLPPRLCKANPKSSLMRCSELADVSGTGILWSDQAGQHRPAWREATCPLCGLWQAHRSSCKVSPAPYPGRACPKEPADATIGSALPCLHAASP